MASRASNRVEGCSSRAFSSPMGTGRSGRPVMPCPSSASGLGPLDSSVKVRSRVSNGESVRGRRRVGTGGSFRFGALIAPRRVPRFSPESSPAGPVGDSPESGGVAGESIPPRRVIPGQRRGVVATRARGSPSTRRQRTARKEILGEPGVRALQGVREVDSPTCGGVGRCISREALARPPGRGASGRPGGSYRSETMR